MKAFKNGLNKIIPKKGKNDDILKDYKMGKVLGSGNFAVVRLATKKDKDNVDIKYAIKIIDKNLCAGKEEMVSTEIAIAKEVNHPHIIKMYDLYDSSDKLYLVLQYVDGGELFQRIVDAGHFTEQDASRITRQITSAVAYLHSVGIVHRDLKPENILFKTKDENSDVMVADFGLSKFINDKVMLQTACGTPNYVAPEVLRQQGYGKEVDMWSIGVITYILLCGYPPFYDENDVILFKKILRGEFRFHKNNWSHISQSAKMLISGILKVNTEHRFTAEQVLNHPWVTGDTALTLNISKSISANFKDYNANRSMVV